MKFDIRVLLVVLGVSIFGIAGCGGDDSTATTGAATEAGSTDADVGEDDDLAASLVDCPEALENYEIVVGSRENAEKAVAEGEAGAQEAVELAEGLLAEAEADCAAERELAEQEDAICSNTPEELAEALEVEDTPANREYIEVYEAACGETVPVE